MYSNPKLFAMISISDLNANVKTHDDVLEVWMTHGDIQKNGDIQYAQLVR